MPKNIFMNDLCLLMYYYCIGGGKVTKKSYFKFGLNLETIFLKLKLK